MTETEQKQATTFTFHPISTATVKRIEQLAKSLLPPSSPSTDAKEASSGQGAGQCQSQAHLSFLLSKDFASACDRADPLASFRDEFYIPKAHPYQDDCKEAIYFCGNSLGPLSKKSEQYVQEEMRKWRLAGVEGHMTGDRPWVSVDEKATELLTDIVGAKPGAGEVAVMNSLSCNLHLLMLAMYKPTASRYKILIEDSAFCSDWHIVRSQLTFHGHDPAEAIIALKPRQGEAYLHTSDIIAAIEENGESIALVMIGGIQFYTGQFFDMKAITAAGHKEGCLVAFDCAHAAGNVPLQLHDWGVDFAAWCSYKYLNAGPGAIAGAFLHERHHTKSNQDMPRMLGWWGQTVKNRFKMSNQHSTLQGMRSFMLSNPPAFTTISLQASLELHNRAGMKQLREKSLKLTGYLEYLIDHFFPPSNAVESGSGSSSTSSSKANSDGAENTADDNGVRTATHRHRVISVITPRDPEQRGSQLSLYLDRPVRPVQHIMEELGVIVDVREPNVMRVSPAAMYNSFTDVYTFVQHLITAMDA